MNLKSQWILTETEIMSFGELRKEEYEKRKVEAVDEEERTRSILQKLIGFVRGRRMSADRPFHLEKFLYIAAILFKRYFLVNCQIEEEPVQCLICAIYLSLKISEFDENFIVKIKDSWRKKPVFEPHRHFKHYGDSGYSQVEQRFLNNIGYQISFSKLIQPVESLFFEIHKNLQLPNSPHNPHNHHPDPAKLHHSQLLHAIFYELTSLYLHPTLLFLFQGPQLALFVVTQAIKKLNLPAALLGSEVKEMVDHNQDLLKLIEKTFCEGKEGKEGREGKVVRERRKQVKPRRRRINRKMKQAAAERAAAQPTKDELDVLPFEAET